MALFLRFTLTLFNLFILLVLLLFLFLLLPLLLLFGLLVLPDGRLQVTLLPLLLLLFLWCGLPGSGQLYFGDKARGVYVVLPRHAAGHEALNAPGGLPGLLAAGGQAHRIAGPGRGRGDGAVTVAHAALLQLLAAVPGKQLRHCQPALPDLRRAGGAERPTGGGHQRAVEAGGHAHQVVHHSVVLGVVREGDGEGVLDFLAQLLAGRFGGGGFGNQVP